MSLTAFLTTALESALDNGMAAPEDVLRHATPDVLGTHLPRPVWARLIETCLAAPRLDARLVVDTVGIGTMCEHVPHPIIWACLAEIAQRALGRGLVAAPPPAPPAVVTASPRAQTAPAVAPTPPVVAPPPAMPVPATAVAESEITRVAAAPIDIAKIAAEKSEVRGEPTRVAGRPPEPEPLGDPPALPRAPGATSRQTGSMAATRRPQASAPTTPPSPPKSGARGTPPPVGQRRATTATDFEIETDVGEQWKKPAAEAAVPVEEDQLIDWAQSEETATTGDKYDRKR